MKNEYQEVDKLITEVLTDEEAKYFKELEEQSLPQQVFGIYKGKMGWVHIYATIVMLPVFGLAVYAGYKFFTIDDTVQMMRWGAIMFLTWMATGFIKLFSWNQMDKNALIREMKRLEFQLSLLAKKE